MIRLLQRAYAGHNKWSKIKRDKSINDISRGKAFGKVSSQIISAISAGNGETDPSLNFYLAAALNKAKQIQMPKSNIEQALLKAKSKESLDTFHVFYEGFGPSGSALIVEALTPNRNKTFNEVRHLFFEYGNLGSVNYLFRRSCFFTLSCDDQEKAQSDIIESNYALNFDEISDSQIQVETLITDCYNFLNYLKPLGHKITSTDIRHEPLERISISPDDKIHLESFIASLKDLDEVVGVYHNVDLDAMLAKLLSDKDTEITKFVNSLEKRLEDLGNVLENTKNQKNELEKDFRFNLSLLKERDQELAQLEKELRLKDLKLQELQQEVSHISLKLRESIDNSTNLKDHLKEQEKIYLENLSNCKKEFQSRLEAKSTEELIFNEKIQELSLKIQEKEDQLREEIQRNEAEKKINLDLNLLEFTKIRQKSEEQIQILQESLEKLQDKMKEKEFRLEDLTLQNSFKYKQIQVLKEKIDQLQESETIKNRLKEEKIQLEESLAILRGQNEQLQQEFEGLKEDSARKIEESDEIILGLSKRNEFLKNDFKEKIMQMEHELKELELQKQVLVVQLDQERGIKESEKEFCHKTQEENLRNLRDKEKELNSIKERIVALESDDKQKSQKLDQLNSHLRKIEIEKIDYEWKLNNEGDKWKRKINHLLEKISLLEKQANDKDAELEKIRQENGILEKENNKILDQLRISEQKLQNDESKAKVLELEETNEQLSSIIHQMRLDMERLQEEYKESHKSQNCRQQDSTPSDDMINDNNRLKNEISELQARIKKLSMEKDRLVDISNSVRSHIRIWKEAQENRQDRSSQTNIILNLDEIMEPSLARNPKVLMRQSDKETESQNRSRIKFSKSTNAYKTVAGEHPERLKSTINSRALKIRNWNDIHD